MSGAPKPRLSRLTADTRDDLVAYLDGELPPEKEREIDRVLVDNEVARREVQRLSEVYELLDYLPRPDVSEDFTQSTMATVLSENPPEEPDNPESKLDVRPLFKAAAWAFVLGWAGIAAGRFVRPSGANEVLRDLPALERLEELRAVQDREFLDWLARDSVRTMLWETAP